MKTTRSSENSLLPSLIAGLTAALVSLAALAAPAWAAPAVVTKTATPNPIAVAKRTDVTVTAKIADVQSAKSLTANLYRLNADNTESKLVQLKDDGTKGDLTAGDTLYTGTQAFNEPQSTTIRLKIVVLYVLTSQPSVVQRAESDVFTVAVGGLVPAGAGTTITGDGGVTLTVAPNAIPYPAFLGVSVADPASVPPTDPATLPLIGAVKIQIDGLGFGSELPEPSVPLDLSFPVNAMPDGGRFIVAKRVVFETVSPQGVPGPPTAQLMPVSLATVVAGKIVTQPGVFDGIRSTGTYAIVGAPGSGFVNGTVREGGLARAGVFVSNSTNSLVTTTSATGAYSLFISGNVNFTVGALHPQRGTAGSATGTIANDGDTVTVDITLAPLQGQPNLRPGIRNGGFERRAANGACELAGWEPAGVVEVLPQFGPTAPFPAGNREGPNGDFFVDANAGGVIIRPSEGDCMAAISTAGVNSGASISQTFHLPPGATHLKIDYNYVSEELPEWVGSQFQDPFRVVVTPLTGPGAGVPVTLKTVQVDDAHAAPGFQVIGDCGFTAGDDTCGMSGWQTTDTDLTAFAGGGPINVQLVFSVTDIGDSIFDTKVLIDNIRFSTVWLDAKIIDAGTDVDPKGEASAAARVRRDVRQANEVLSEAGINVRIRGDGAGAGPRTVAGAALVPVEQLMPHAAGSPNYCLSGNVHVVGADGVELTNLLLKEPDEISLMTVSRSGSGGGAAGSTTRDVNVYYVASSSVNANGWSANPGDFCTQVSIVTNTNWGSLITNLATERTLTHELGHQLITAISGVPGGPGTILHNCSSTEGECFTVSGASATAVVTSEQSLAINSLSTILQP